MEKMKKMLSEVKFSKFEAEMGEIGIFHFCGTPEIIWVKINGRGMLKLQQQVDKVLEEDFQKESRFMSHVTIACVKHTLDKNGFEEYVIVKDISLSLSTQGVNEELSTSLTIIR